MSNQTNESTSSHRKVREVEPVAMTPREAIAVAAMTGMSVGTIRAIRIGVKVHDRNYEDAIGALARLRRPVKRR